MILLLLKSLNLTFIPFIQLVKYLNLINQRNISLRSPILNLILIIKLQPREPPPGLPILLLPPNIRFPTIIVIVYNFVFENSEVLTAYALLEELVLKFYYVVPLFLFCLEAEGVLGFDLFDFAAEELGLVGQFYVFWL